MDASTPDSGPQHPRPRLAPLALLLVVLLWLVLVVTPVWLQAARACFPNFDLGIYSQAVARLSLAQPNPWISARQVFIFNDHFDPILWVAHPLARLLPPMWAALVVEALFVLLTVAPLLWLQVKGLLSRRALVLLTAR
ncbi:MULTISPECIES: DUF2079 domain-containing protein [Myxococcus]|uniref:DUF2079 domain-containing protein n=1 Tax=Myxococcus TaxID=32 RepID=UPI001E2D9AEB|nr:MULTISPECIES: DUF2079 domain-containing protein [Myxococcus]MCK8500257.1 DUF2079 domain-containing protein [Myxococcus fulvus]